MSKAQPIRITTAGRSRAEDIAIRQKRYAISMSIRSLCFIGAVIAGLAGIGWLWPILIVAALILPYVAVVMANATNTKSDEMNLMDSPYGPRQLTSGGEQQLREKGEED